MSTTVMTKRWTREDGTYLEVCIGSDGSAEFDITDPHAGPYGEGYSFMFTVDGNEVNDLRELLS